MYSQYKLLDFSDKEKIESLSGKYQKLYGLVPEFRAGLHYGLATVGEIGKIKKEITYFRDVMNTTSRTQGLCKESKSHFGMHLPPALSGDLFFLYLY